MKNKIPEKTNDAPEHVKLLARLITKRMLQHVFSAEETVKNYIDKNLQQIVELGLGLERDRWSTKGPKIDYRFAQTNGFSGPLKDYIVKLGRNYAEKNIEAVADEIFKKRLKTIDETLTREVQSIYADAYRSYMWDFLSDKIKENDTAIEADMVKIIEEATMQLRVLSSEQINKFIKRLDDK